MSDAMNRAVERLAAVLWASFQHQDPALFGKSITADDYREQARTLLRDLGLVVVDPALVHRVMAARKTRESAVEEDERTGRATSLEVEEALDAEDDANATLADAVLAQLRARG